ncbi:selenide, water dikinase SelD [Paenarthrobacter nicotinovorans]|jgi:selenide, water dikinase|uniref:selenide, water dikinase SelD n=1 Tax=Paenarthrobacter nicotinovorans TaxID=29320 RepID=UPI002780F636|nr:selenide, water dikinase SelD [Paenarthrobacter nicotinovorans]MDP9933937.1 selenide,water dikinase [Paenarthrobacter nicotinovorans]
MNETQATITESDGAPEPAIRLTDYAHGGGCACKIPPGELEDAVRGLIGQPDAKVLVGLDNGDDAAAVLVRNDLAVLSTADFFTPVVNDAFDWGRIAAANALSDIYAMGGQPVAAINLVGWPRGVLPMELMTEVLRGGLSVASQAGCPVLGGHSIDDPEPKYGMAVTGVAHPDRLLRNDAAQPGLPITLTKPLGVGLLNNRHKKTGEVFAEAVETMAALNREASEAAVAAGLRAATDVTGFGLLGHLHKMLRASGVGAVIDLKAVPLLDGALEALRDGFVSGGTRRNLEWVQPHVVSAPGITEDDLLLLADAQTSGGLLVIGELPGYPVIGHTTAGQGIEVR